MEREKGGKRMGRNQHIPESKLNFTNTIAQALKNTANGGTVTGLDAEKIKDAEQELFDEE
jgi:hypothetical protein